MDKSGRDGEMGTESPLAEALRKVEEARDRYFHGATAQIRRDADEDLNFWMGKVTALSTFEDDANMARIRKNGPA